MMELHVGDHLMYLGDEFRVLGVSPMSTSPRRIYLENLRSGERSETGLDEIRREALTTGLTDIRSRPKG